MAAKRKLDDMLADENSKPVIRRGQGVRLSTEEAPPVVLRAQDRTVAETQDRTVAETQDRTVAETQDRTVAETQPNATKRVNRGYMLREDLILGCKRLALNDGRKLYEVMEEALAEYLSRHGQAAS